jgi:hypothetical protein
MIRVAAFNSPPAELFQETVDRCFSLLAAVLVKGAQRSVLREQLNWPQVVMCRLFQLAVLLQVAASAFTPAPPSTVLIVGVCRFVLARLPRGQEK